jgi:chemotaxis protein methyltransferase CheR
MNIVKDRALLDENGLKEILCFILDHKGIDVSNYRKSFLLRRIRLRLLATNVKDYREYIELLKKDDNEFNLFLDKLSINVTEFFRDPDVFTAFKRQVLPEIIQRKQACGNHNLRIWSSACASGEEPYSIAILMQEALGDRHNFALRIWASDIDAQVLEKAKKGEYPQASLQKIAPHILKKYFTPAGEGFYRLNDTIRQMVKFQAHNIFHEPPFKWLDVIFCRNVMIYLDRSQTKELFIKFNRLLNPKGYLVLGKVEMLWEKDLFTPVDLKEKIYQKAG